MGIWEAIKAVFNTTFKNPVLFLPSLAIVVLAGLFIGAILLLSGIGLGQLSSLVTNPSTSMTSLVQAIGGTFTVLFLIFIGAILSLVLSPLITGTYLSAATQTGDAIDIGAAFGKARSKWASILGVILINGVIGGLASTILGAIPVLGQVLSFVAGLVIDVLLFLAAAVVILEDRGAVNAVQRSIDLGKENFWNILFLFIVFGIIIGAIAIVIVGLGVGAALAIGGLSYASAAAVVIALAILFIIIGPLSGMLPVAFYYEFGLNKGTTAKQPQMQQAPMQAPPPPPPAAPTPKAKAKRSKKASKTS